MKDVVESGNSFVNLSCRVKRTVVGESFPCSAESFDPLVVVRGVNGERDRRRLRDVMGWVMKRKSDMNVAVVG